MGFLGLKHRFRRFFRVLGPKTVQKWVILKKVEKTYFWAKMVIKPETLDFAIFGGLVLSNTGTDQANLCFV